MKSLTILIFIGTILLFILAAAKTINSEQLSTTFVLDTSDSDSPAPAAIENPEPASSVPKPTLRSLEDKNTRIITDESSENHNNNNSNNNKTKLNNQPTSHNHQQATQQTNQQPAHNTNQQHQPTSTHNPTHQPTTTHNSSQQQHHGNNQTVSTQNKRTLQESRKLEEEVSQLAPAVHRHTNGNGGSSSSSSSSQHNHNQHHQKSTTTTTTTTTTSSPESDTPKTEERLLISITSNNDDDGQYSKPQKAGGYGSDESSLQVPTSSSSSQQQQAHHHNKRKPSITISIQDANINKPNGAGGGSSPAAVIVRPGEDGQSIVIATVGSANVGSNKFKPGESISVPLGSISNQQQQPYREPINNPIQSIINQHHQISTSTHRPPLNEDYNSDNNNNNNRPITSTLVEQQRPPSHQLTDERPQRPVQTNLDDHSSSSSSGYETPKPNRPITNTPKPEPPYSGSSYNDQTSQNGGLSSNYEQQQAQTGNNNQQQQHEQYATSSSSSSELKFPLNEKNCGVMHETRIVGGEEADPDDFMWMAAIIKSKPKDGEPRPFCGGSLITRRHILTAAHCLEGLAPRDVLIRLGSYDFDDSSASSSSADYAIDQFRVPAQYSKKTHVADIAIMRLKTPLSQGDNYKTVCMPQPRRSYVGALGTVTGYGSQSQTFRRAAPKLRQVTVPIWENRKCSVVYKKNLTDSFLCAGYEEGGKDACQGDSGGPLMTEGPDQKMMIVGVVSHGIGCGSPGYPGVYTRTTTFTDWIEKNTRE